MYHVARNTTPNNVTGCANKQLFAHIFTLVTVSGGIIFVYIFALPKVAVIIVFKVRLTYERNINLQMKSSNRVAHL